MRKASPESIDAFLKAVRAHFPEPDLLANLSAPQALDDISEVWISTLTQIFTELPTRQKALVETYCATAHELAQRGRPARPLEGERAELAASLARSLARYHIERSVREQMLRPEVISQYGASQLRSMIETIEHLRSFQRTLLRTLLEAEERAGARARDRALQETRSSLSLDLSPVEPLPAHDTPPSSIDAREKMRELRARHESELQRAMELAQKPLAPKPGG